MAGAGAEGGHGRGVGFSDGGSGRVVDEGGDDGGAGLFADVSEAGFADAVDWVCGGCRGFEGEDGGVCDGVWGGGWAEGEDLAVGGGGEWCGEGGGGGDGEG